MLIACGLAGVLAFTAATVLVSGPSYTIAAKVLVNFGPEMAATPLLRAREPGTQSPSMRRPEDSATGVEIFTDPRLIRDTVVQLGDDFFADTPPVTFFQHIKHAAKVPVRAMQDMLRETLVLIGLRPRTTKEERLTLAIGKGLRVEPVKRTDIIAISLAFPDPRAGEVILQRFLTLALSGYLQAYRSSGTTKFFHDGRASLVSELRAAEDRLLKFRLAETDPVWSMAEQRPVLIRSEAELRTRLVQLSLDLSDKQTRYGEGSQEISDIRRQIDTVEARIQNLRSQLQRMETAAVEIAVLEQDATRLRRALDVYDRGFEEARLAEAIEAQNHSGLRVVMPPTAEILPTSPSPMRILLLGLVGGLALGVGLILFREYRAHAAAATHQAGGPMALEPPSEPRRVDAPRSAA